jgi:hypothetical protein
LMIKSFRILHRIDNFLLDILNKFRVSSFGQELTADGLVDAYIR